MRSSPTKFREKISRPRKSKKMAHGITTKRKPIPQKALRQVCEYQYDHTTAAMYSSAPNIPHLDKCFFISLLQSYLH